MPGAICLKKDSKVLLNEFLLRLCQGNPSFHLLPGQLNVPDLLLRQLQVAVTRIPLPSNSSQILWGALKDFGGLRTNSPNRLKLPYNTKEAISLLLYCTW